MNDAIPRPQAKTRKALTPLLEIRNLTKSYDGQHAVDDVSLTIYKGEIFALLGASGCGKSTLLRMLAGFEQPSAGQIMLDGVDLSQVPPYLRPINMMFQSYALFPHMTVEQNIAFGLKQDKPRNYCGGGAGALWQVSRIKWLCLYDHRAAGNARCHHGLVAVVIIRRACSCHWLACGPRYAHHLAGACHFLYGLCGGRYFFKIAGTGSLDRRSSDGSWCDATESVFRHYATDDHARDHFWLVTGFYFVA